MPGGKIVLHCLNTNQMQAYWCIYLSLKNIERINASSKDQYLKYYDKRYSKSSKNKKAFIIPGRCNMKVNNTYHYTVSVKDIKKVCKEFKVTVTEYLTAIYMYSLYNTYYNKNIKKDIIVSIPINLRPHYEDDTLSNFFTYTNIESNFVGKDRVNFDECLLWVKDEFLYKLNSEKIKEYLARDVKLGMNLSIRLVPLFIKKLFIKYMGKSVTNSATSRLSNVGIINIDEEYKKYIDNIFVLVLPNKVQKIKCTICSYDDKLNITMNSNIKDDAFEKEFLNNLKHNIGKVDIESNIVNRKGRR